MRNSTIYIGTIKSKYSTLVDSLQGKKQVLRKKNENLDYEFEIVRDEEREVSVIGNTSARVSSYKIYKYSKDNRVPTFDPDNAVEGMETISKRLLHSNAYLALVDFTSAKQGDKEAQTLVVIETKPPHIGQKLVMRLLSGSQKRDLEEEDVEFNFYPSAGTLDEKLSELDEISLFKAYDLEINDGAPFVVETFEQVSSKAGATSIEAKAPKNSKGIKKNSALVEGATYLAKEGKAKLKIEGKDKSGELSKYNSEEGRNLEQASIKYSDDEERKMKFWEATLRLIKGRFGH